MSNVGPYSISSTTLLVPNHPAPEIKLLRAAYTAFNARDIDAALATMTPDVAWPKAFKGGFVRGPGPWKSVHPRPPTTVPNFRCSGRRSARCAAPSR